MLVGNAGSPHALLQAHFPNELFPQLRGFNHVMGPVEFGTNIQFEEAAAHSSGGGGDGIGGGGGGTRRADSDSSSPAEVWDDIGCTAPVRKLHDGYVFEYFHVARCLIRKFQVLRVYFQVVPLGAFLENRLPRAFISALHQNTFSTRPGTHLSRCTPRTPTTKRFRAA